MTWPRKENARGLGGREDDARNIGLRRQCSTPSPECGKWAAVALYSHDILSLHRVAAMFRAHPEWRRA